MKYSQPFPGNWNTSRSPESCLTFQSFGERFIPRFESRTSGLKTNNNKQLCKFLVADGTHVGEIAGEVYV
ncbi:hypothetical protein V22_38710 [Calycomorphotria hydatis]|uniref:Uncharacterized protein n=1 Tax=Calycomorphotria hydatis TaxID=2528027 RepID=A0A517TE00_9PLAN|nr:hypothetical protein V22_38710 [Calycomorphotria hydatis]